jgi:N-dimethylarginine dimethylaminohydrolase
MSKRILMCPPTHFEVRYEINPWMHCENPVRSETARTQWQALYRTYSEKIGWDVLLMDAQPAYPDLVFTANGGLVVDGKVVLPCFRHPERQGEAAHFATWFATNGIVDQFSPRQDFEGEGDALLWNKILFIGYPWRTDLSAHVDVARYLEVEAVSLQLADARFYHLDTAMTIVDDSTVAIYAPAFTPESVRQIQDRVPRVIRASEADALAYGLNAFSDGKHIVLSDQASDLIGVYRSMGLEVWPTAIGEFMKSGGGVKCLSLELRGQPSANSHV